MFDAVKIRGRGLSRYLPVSFATLNARNDVDSIADLILKDFPEKEAELKEAIRLADQKKVIDAETGEVKDFQQTFKMLFEVMRDAEYAELTVATATQQVADRLGILRGHTITPGLHQSIAEFRNILVNWVQSQKQMWTKTGDLAQQMRFRANNIAISVGQDRNFLNSMLQSARQMHKMLAEIQSEESTLSKLEKEIKGEHDPDRIKQMESALQSELSKAAADLGQFLPALFNIRTAAISMIFSEEAHLHLAVTLLKNLFKSGLSAAKAAPIQKGYEGIEKSIDTSTADYTWNEQELVRRVENVLQVFEHAESMLKAP